MNRLVGSKGYAVNFRQVFGNLETSESGLVTVGVTGLERTAGGSPTFPRRSRATGRSAGTAKLSAAGAWTAAARNAGLTKIGRERAQPEEDPRLDAARRRRGAGQPAGEARRVPDRAARRRSCVRDRRSSTCKTPLALRTFVDAATGRILARSNLVDNAAQGKIKLAAGESFTFSGSFPRPMPPATRTARSRSAPATARSTASRPRPSRRTTSSSSSGKDGVRLDPGGHAVLAGAVPLRAGGRHPGRQLRDQGLRLPGWRRLGCPDGRTPGR